MTFSRESLNIIIKALKDDSAGNKPCTMTDLDFAAKMLEGLADQIEILQVEKRNSWEHLCETSAHLKVLSKVVIDKNQSAAMQFALQSEGILNRFAL